MEKDYAWMMLSLMVVAVVVSHLWRYVLQRIVNLIRNDDHLDETNVGFIGTLVVAGGLATLPMFLLEESYTFLVPGIIAVIVAAPVLTHLSYELRMAHIKASAEDAKESVG